jgi:hypothetical protein
VNEPYVVSPETAAEAAHVVMSCDHVMYAQRVVDAARVLFDIHVGDAVVRSGAHQPARTVTVDQVALVTAHAVTACVMLDDATVTGVWSPVALGVLSERRNRLRDALGDGDVDLIESAAQQAFQVLFAAAPTAT